jgi:hypothetical protein
MVSLAMYSHVSYSSELCQWEKSRVDAWNESLKDRSTERGREGHREAKNDFLDCLREAKKKKKSITVIKSSSSQSQVTPTQTKRSFRSNKRTRTKKTTKFQTAFSTEHNREVSFTEFQGKKLKKWREFYVETAACRNNTQDMSLFIKCAEEKKRHLSEFNSRWDPNLNSLRPHQ